MKAEKWKEFDEVVEDLRLSIDYRQVRGARIYNAHRVLDLLAAEPDILRLEYDWKREELCLVIPVWAHVGDVESYPALRHFKGKLPEATLAAVKSDEFTKWSQENDKAD